MTLEAQFAVKWGWYGSIDVISGGDILKQDAVVKLPLYQFLTKLLYEKDKQDLEARRLKQR